MTDSHRFLVVGAIGGALLLLVGCSSNESPPNGGGQNTQPGNGGSSTGTSSASSTQTGNGGSNGSTTNGNQTTLPTTGGTGSSSTGVDSKPLGGAGGSSQASSSSSGGTGTSNGSSSRPVGGSSAQVGGATARGGSGQNSGSTVTVGGGTSPAGGGSIGNGGKTGTAASGNIAGQSGSQPGGAANRGGSGGGGQTGGTTSACVGKQWPTASPTAAGPFQVQADKNVGPLAGYTPDPIYGDQQQRFNVYRPKNLSDSGYCHPIVIWANGHTDNPEPNPPLCVVDSGANKWCGQYLPMMNHLASHGFVVVASLSTTTSRGDPLPTIAGLDWILQQSEDSTSPYYHRLDTANIGQLGHSEGGMSTCMVASEPRYKALMSICGTRTLTGVHTPMLFFCGGKDTTVACSGVHDVFATVKDQPAFFMNEKNSDHGSWVYGGAGSPSLSGAAAWFRIHLMGDTANRKYFYGSNCTFCADSRVTAEQNSLMAM